MEKAILIVIFWLVFNSVEGFPSTNGTEGANITACTENHLFHNESGRCFTVNSRGPCGELMRFLAVSPKSKFGYCDCDPLDDDNNNCTYRPKIFWRRENRCYYAFDQGPCLSGEWLMIETEFYYSPFCTQNPCLKMQNNSTGAENEFWFLFGGRCYQTGTQGFCREAKYKVYIKRNEFDPLCLADSSCQKLTNSTFELLDQTPENGRDAECDSGSRNYVGRCRRRKGNIQFG